MSRPWQVFVAPGPDSQALPTTPSPWHSGRWVRIPREHWELILDFGNEIDNHLAHRLRYLSYAADDNEMDYVYASQEELETLLLFVKRLANEIERAEPLITMVTDEVPDMYPNEEHARMLKCVEAVFRESMRLSQPFRAWSE